MIVSLRSRPEAMTELYYQDSSRRLDIASLACMLDSTLWCIYHVHLALDSLCAIVILAPAGVATLADWQDTGEHRPDITFQLFSDFRKSPLVVMRFCRCDPDNFASPRDTQHTLALKVLRYLFSHDCSQRGVC